jgi:hypothetical protein
MDPSKYRPALDAYCTLLEEAKQRLLVMEVLLNGKTGLHGGAVHESCYLQLRMLCEVIALGCLIAQGDIEPSGKIKKAYEAGKIIRYLETLHPEFYPHAATQTKSGPDTYDAVIIGEGFLTKNELIQLYNKCGNILHRGTVRDVFGYLDWEPSHAEIRAWKAKIETLLRLHIIFMLDKQTFVLFVSSNIANNNKVNCLVGECESSTDFAKVGARFEITMEAET